MFLTRLLPDEDLSCKNFVKNSDLQLPFFSLNSGTSRQGATPAYGLHLFRLKAHPLLDLRAVQTRWAYQQCVSRSRYRDRQLASTPLLEPEFKEKAGWNGPFLAHELGDSDLR